MSPTCSDASSLHFADSVCLWKVVAQVANGGVIFRGVLKMVNVVGLLSRWKMTYFGTLRMDSHAAFAVLAMRLDVVFLGSLQEAGGFGSALPGV